MRTELKSPTTPYVVPPARRQPSTPVRIPRPASVWRSYGPGA